MRILQLCTRVPYPPDDGGTIAMYNLQKALCENGAVLKVLAFNTVKQYVDLEKLDEGYKKMTRIEAVYLDNRIKPFGAFLNLFTGESYHIIRFIRRDFEEMLVRVLEEEEFDIVQLESLFMMPYFDVIRSRSSAKIVLRTHNIEHLIWHRLSFISGNPLRRWYLKLLTSRLKEYEQWAISRLDAIAAMTPEDRTSLLAMGASEPVHIAPVGLDVDGYQSDRKEEPGLIIHIGAMDWMPNQEGVRWFIEKVWPAVKSAVPAARLAIAGKKMPESFMEYAGDSVLVEGFVPDARGFMAAGAVMIVPLFSGSGMRVKIIEGMAMGKAIVTTPIGAEGIPGRDGQEFLLADTPESFAGRVVELLLDSRRRNELGRKAREFAGRYFDNNVIGKDLIAFYRGLIHKTQGAEK